MRKACEVYRKAGRSLGGPLSSPTCTVPAGIATRTAFRGLCAHKAMRAAAGARVGVEDAEIVIDRSKLALRNRTPVAPATTSAAIASTTTVVLSLHLLNPDSANCSPSLPFAELCE